MSVLGPSGLTSANMRITPTLSSFQLTPGSLWKPIGFKLNPGGDDSKNRDTRPLLVSLGARWWGVPGPELFSSTRDWYLHPRIRSTS
jgi:hypothetical protein